MARSAVLAPLLLAGCMSAAADPARGPDPTRRIETAFTCDDGSALSVVYAGDTATVTARQGTFVLPQQPSGSGFLYSNGRYSLRGQGDEARWEVGRMAPILCKVR